MEGKQTAALVRKGPKLQPIAPTQLFTSHCSVITPKETDDLEKQFDQSQVKIKEIITNCQYQCDYLFSIVDISV